MTHMHITSWVVAIILFIVTLVLMKNKNDKGAKIVSMILRLFYLFVIATGIMLYLAAPKNIEGYHIKMLAGILVIVLMEMIFASMKKQKPNVLYWILFIVILITTVYLGFTLPLGISL